MNQKQTFHSWQYSSMLRPLTIWERLFLLALLLLTAACQPPDRTANLSPEEPSGLRLGTLLPITGDLAQYGASMQDAAALLVENVNRCEGVLGRPVKLVTEDTQTEPSRGAAAMTKLAEVNQVHGVIGAASSAISTAAIDIAVRNQIVQISPGSTSPVFTDRARNGDFNGFWFRTVPSDALQGPTLAQLAYDRGFQSIAVIAINNDYGNGLSDAFISAFTALGGEVTNSTQATLYPPDAVTFDAEVNEAFSSNPDAVVLIAYPETGSLVIRAAFEQGYLDGNTQVLLTEGMKSATIGPLVGQDAKGQFIISGALGTAPKPGGPALEAFLNAYESAYNRKPELFDANTWDAAALLVLAAQAGGDTSSVAIKDNLIKVSNAPGTEVSDVCQALGFLREGQEINYQGASSEVDFDEFGDIGGRYNVWTIDPNGQLQVIDTITAKSSTQ